ncbi:hypothetical protein OC846_006610 [Tilletia horrida]|uniref:Uncharacterized protein n=1 Tax=Tilletia horrida TaxID=155126 RepID=A0AAN6GJ53_9BASI|nr:hypothetical protein OC846_006610 [Tilletia horrida]
MVNELPRILKSEKWAGSEAATFYSDLPSHLERAQRANEAHERQKRSRNALKKVQGNPAKDENDPRSDGSGGSDEISWATLPGVTEAEDTSVDSATSGKRTSVGPALPGEAPSKVRVLGGGFVLPGRQAGVLGSKDVMNLLTSGSSAVVLAPDSQVAEDEEETGPGSPPLVFPPGSPIEDEKKDPWEEQERALQTLVSGTVPEERLPTELAWWVGVARNEPHVIKKMLEILGFDTTRILSIGHPYMTDHVAELVLRPASLAMYQARLRSIGIDSRLGGPLALVTVPPYEVLFNRPSRELDLGPSKLEQIQGARRAFLTRMKDCPTEDLEITSAFHHRRRMLRLHWTDEA